MKVVSNYNENESNTLRACVELGCAFHRVTDSLSESQSLMGCISYKCDWLVKQELPLEANLGGLRDSAQKPGATCR